MSAQDDAIARYRSGMNKDLSEAYNLCSRKRHTIVKKPKNRIGRSIIWRLGQLFADNTGPHKSSRKVQCERFSCAGNGKDVSAGARKKENYHRQAGGRVRP